jgi:hypothetical protein
MIDILNVLLQYISMQAALVGVIAVQLYKYMVPSPTGGKNFQTIPGKIYDRLLPFVGPLAAMLACLALEWRIVHPEIGASGLVPQDIVKGLLSGLASEFFLRIYYKTLMGI